MGQMSFFWMDSWTDQSPLINGYSAHSITLIWSKIYLPDSIDLHMASKFRLAIPQVMNVTVKSAYNFIKDYNHLAKIWMEKINDTLWHADNNHPLMKNAHL